MKFSALFRMEKTFKSLKFWRKIAAGGFIGGMWDWNPVAKGEDIINKGINLKMSS